MKAVVNKMESFMLGEGNGSEEQDVVWSRGQGWLIFYCVRWRSKIR